MHHTVTLQPSGRSFLCADSEVILKAGLDSGAGLPFSCRSGLCRSCRGRLTAGGVDLGEVHPAYLDAQERAAGYVHLCQARPLGDCVIEIDEIDAALGYPLQQLPARVLSMQRVAPDVMLLQLGLPSNEPARFRAGQYLDIVGKDGLRRSYSIANAPQADGVRQLELHIRHLPGGAFTDRVFGELKVRDIVRVELPLGSFQFDEQSDKPMLLLASGTGFAPIKAIVEHCIARGIARPIRLYWGGRRREDLYLHELAEAWCRAHPHIAYVPVLSEATPACDWHGRDGFVHQAVLRDLPDLRAYQVYACGAPVVVESARRDFSALAGLPASAFLADAFVSAADKASHFPAERISA